MSATRTLLRALALVGFVGVVATGPIAAAETPSRPPVVSRTLSVAQAVELALQNSPALASRRAMAEAAAARAGMARAMTRLQVSTSTFATSSSMAMIASGPGEVMPQSLTMAPETGRLGQTAMAMVPLLTGGRLRSQERSAAAAREASALDATTAELDLALAVKLAYYRVLLARSFLAAYERRVTEATERVRIAQAAYDVGRVARYDLLRNQTELAEAQQRLSNKRRDSEISLADLKAVLGISQASELVLSDTLEDRQDVPERDGLQARALSLRPELAAAQARLRSTELSLRAARAESLPQVYGTAMAEAAYTRGMSDSGSLIGLVAALPLLDGGLRRSRVAEAQAMLAQMRSEEREIVLSVERDVAASIAELDAALRNVPLAQAAVAQAEEDYRVIRMRYEAGRATNVEVLDALASLTRAETAYAEAIYAQNAARETLTRATGGR